MTLITRGFIRDCAPTGGQKRVKLNESSLPNYELPKLQLNNSQSKVNKTKGSVDKRLTHFGVKAHSHLHVYCYIEKVRIFNIS